MVRKLETLSEIAEIDRSTNDIIVNNVYSWSSNPEGYEYSGYSYVIRRLAERTGENMEDLMAQLVIRGLFLERLAESGITRFSDVTSQVNRLYRTRESILKEFGL